MSIYLKSLTELKRDLNDNVKADRILFPKRTERRLFWGARFLGLLVVAILAVVFSVTKFSFSLEVSSFVMLVVVFCILAPVVCASFWVSRATRFIVDHSKSEDSEGG